MFYLLKAYKAGTNTLVTKREVVGIAAAEWQRKRWESRGYEVNLMMQCTKYIAIKRITNPQSLAPRITAKPAR